MTNNEQEIINKIRNKLEELAEPLVKEHKGNIEDDLEKLDVIWNMCKMLDNYDHSIDVLKKDKTKEI